MNGSMGIEEGNVTDNSHMKDKLEGILLLGPVYSQDRVKLKD
jgi:hypothetical protein